LLVAIGELCQLAGWVASDAGRYGIAEHLYLAGVRASHAGGDTAGAANNLSSLSYQVANIGRAADAVVLARSALCGAHKAPATVRALLLERVAWAQARVDDDRACDRALGDVEDAYAQQRPDDDPIWVYWLDPDEIAVMAGRCWTQLRRPLRAVPILERAIAGYGDDIARETSLYLTWLAEALTQAHEVDQAAELAQRALALAVDAGSIRATDRIDVIRRLLRPYRTRPAVTAFDDRYQAWKADRGQQPEG
jgi:tetratricopeptide (TPR) repeat protein